MKKIFIVTLIAVSIIGTQISFAQTENQTVKLTQELMRINDDLSLAFSSILSGNPDVDRLKKDLNFTKTRLNAVIREVQDTIKSSDSLLKERELRTIQYLAINNLLSTNGLLLFLEDTNNNQNFLLDAITSYNEGLRILEELQEAIYKIYKIQLDTTKRS